MLVSDSPLTILLQSLVILTNSVMMERGCPCDIFKACVHLRKDDSKALKQDCLLLS